MHGRLRGSSPAATLFEFTQAFGDVPESDEKAFLHQVISYMVSRDV